MNEEQAVLDFFSKQENLPLGLSVAEQMDEIRARMNTLFWQEVITRIETAIRMNSLPWHVAATEDRNSTDGLAGMHCNLTSEQSVFLRPMIEQQYAAGTPRIYLGLMWSGTPSATQLSLPEVKLLQTKLQNAGFKTNENFLGWQWTMLYPRRRDFLMRFAQAPNELLLEIERIFNTLVLDHGELIACANTALRNGANDLSASILSLRDELLG